MGFSPVAGAAFAQGTHPDRPPQRQQPPANSNAGGNRPPAQNPSANRAPKQNPQQNQPHNQSRHADRPQTRPNQPPPDRTSQDRNPQRNDNRPPSATIGPNRSNNFAPNNSNNRPNASSNRPNSSFDQPNGGFTDRPNNSARLTPRQQVGVGSAPRFVDRMRDFTPQQRERVLQDSRTFQSLAPEQQNRIRNQFSQWDRMSPQQRADLREKENTWRNLTPQQRDYIKGDVMPRWRQVPWQRQQAIQQKLGVLQNMPESARNRRLADPNFTRGMSDEDRAMLHDLSHLHVGGAPDPPGNEP
jgi:uncharacterized protein DUF3106